MRPSLSIPILLASVLAPTLASADTFEAGSLVIPMDTDYQDEGTLEAFGLVYQLLRNDIHVHWVIKSGKVYGGADFVASGVDLQTGEPILQHAYRGGPWVIAGDAEVIDAAKEIIAQWQMSYPLVNVHETTVAFEGDVAHTLVVAPTIAMLADGNQKIARKYMIAARIPDSIGDPLWPDSSPDMLTVDEVSGPTDTNHADGALFDDVGNPVYCQFMSMHWGVGDAEDHPEVVAEVRQFLHHPTHFYAQCQAVNAFENLEPHGFYLTQNGFLIGDRPSAYDFAQMDTPFGQLDGAFASVGGSEPAYTLPPGDTYKAQDIVLITEAGTPIGTNDVWMTGYLDGICPQAGSGDPPIDGTDDPVGVCLSRGKVSYLGGHEYDVAVPISSNPNTQGARLFLNSLFEAPCATEEGFPEVTLTNVAPAQTTQSEVTFTLEYANLGPLPVLGAMLTNDLIADSSFVSATDDGVLQDTTLIWALGNLAAGQSGSVSFTVDLPSFGTYQNIATVVYRVGINDFSRFSNETSTEYGEWDDETTGGSSSTGTDDAGATASEGEGGVTAGTGLPDDSGTSGGNSGGFGGGEIVEGCGCQSSGPESSWWLMLGLLALPTGRRRRA
jgi:MYXO-CTERM domain-containing protein